MVSLIFLIVENLSSEQYKGQILKRRICEVLQREPLNYSYLNRKFHLIFKHNDVLTCTPPIENFHETSFQLPIIQKGLLSLHSASEEPLTVLLPLAPIFPSPHYSPLCNVTLPLLAVHNQRG